MFNCFQDEKDQVLVTNVWLDQVCISLETSLHLRLPLLFVL